MPTSGRIASSKLLEGLFFCHLALEKTIKALVVATTGDIPPRTHNLLRLAELAGAALTDENAEFLGEMMQFHIEGRYPGSRGIAPEIADCRRYLEKTKGLTRWLMDQS